MAHSNDKQQYNYESVRKRLDEWYRDSRIKYASTSILFELSRDEKEVMVIDFTFKHCIAQLSVAVPDFAPYEFISFEALAPYSAKALKQGYERVYFFYDSADMVEEEVVCELERALAFLVDYKPDRLGKEFIKQRGFVNLGSENPVYLIHPDDRKKFPKDSLQGEFECVDTDSQYLVLENSEMSLRVVPRVFKRSKKKFREVFTK